MDRSHSPEDNSLISTTTILILSAVLIGMAVGKVAGELLSPYLLGSGILGCLSYLLCDAAAERRRHLREQTEQRLMERRLDKHVSAPNAAEAAKTQVDLLAESLSDLDLISV